MAAHHCFSDSFTDTTSREGESRSRRKGENEGDTDVERV